MRFLPRDRNRIHGSDGQPKKTAGTIAPAVRRSRMNVNGFRPTLPRYEPQNLTPTVTPKVIGRMMAKP